MNMKNLKVSVVIPAYNSQETIGRCVESVLRNTYVDFEVIVVDDGSLDRTSVIVGAVKDQRLKLHVVSGNKGPSYARNQGVRLAEGVIVLLLDADSFVDDDWIQCHAALHEVCSADIIGGSVIGIHKTPFGKADYFCSSCCSIPGSGDYFLKNRFLITNNMSIRKELFGKIGYFDETLRAGEDVDFCARAIKNNAKIYFNAKVVIYHFDRDCLGSFLAHQKKWAAQQIKVRLKQKLDFWWLFPRGYRSSYFYIIPVALLFTCYIACRWLKYRPSVLFYVPLIFMGKWYQAIEIKNFLKSTRYL